MSLWMTFRRTLMRTTFGCLFIAGGGDLCGLTSSTSANKCPADAGVGLDAGLEPLPIADAPLAEGEGPAEGEADAGEPSEPEPPSGLTPTPVDAGCPPPAPRPSGPWSAFDFFTGDPLPFVVTEYFRICDPRLVCTQLHITNPSDTEVRWWEAATPYIEGHVYGTYNAADPVAREGRWSFQPEPRSFNAQIRPGKTVEFSFCADHW